MNPLDHRLRSLVRRSREASLAPVHTATFIAGASARTAAGVPQIEVLVRCAGPGAAERLAAAGMEIWSVIPGASPVVAGAAALDVLEALGEIEGVERLEASRPLGHELDLSRRDCRVESLHLPPDPAIPAVRGAGVAIGIIDTGIDYRHPKFRRDDGTSRILFLWDQSAGPDPAGPDPRVPFGREFSRDELDAALATGEPLEHVPHRDRDGHGTHVAGIAAGNGRGGLRFRGVAPEADLIVVASRSDGDTLGRSASALAAYQYLFDRAAGRPLVVNQSQGMNGGGHSGETVLETGIDNLLRHPGVVAVKSAGNEQRWRIHAGGEIEDGKTVTRSFRIQQGNTLASVFELWYDGGDTISVAVKPPGEPSLAFVSPADGAATFETEAGNEVDVLFDRDADDTGDTQATIEITPHQAAKIRPGKWRLLLRGDQVEHGRFDVWIERVRRPGGKDRFQARFQGPSADPTRTVTIPGTARRIVTVGAYVTRDAPPAGRIAEFSSRGPTRYGLQKPDLAAPGQFIISARSSDSTRLADPDVTHTSLPGTSMAAPHVAGTAALILSVRPELTCEHVQQILRRSARVDVFSDDAPDDTWGSGKLDAEAAVELARDVLFPAISEVTVDGAEIAWRTDVATTATVNFHRRRRRVLLGRPLGTRTELSPATAHRVDLSGLGAGTWFCEILAFSEDGFRTTDDHGGACYEVVVG